MRRTTFPESDPIQSSPAREQDTTFVIDDGDSDADALFDGIDPSAHNPPQKISQIVARGVSSSPPRRDRFVTQPTQILNTPPRPHANVQVPRTSPLVDTQESPLPLRPPPIRPLGSRIAPPGTSFNPPPAVPPRSTQSQFNDPPIDISSDEDDLSRPNHSDIKRTRFTVGGKMASQREELNNPGPRVSSFSDLNINKFAHKEAPQKRPAPDDAVGANGNSTRPAKLLRQTGPSRARPVEEAPQMTITEIMDYRIRENVRRIRQILPDAKVADCEQALFQAKGNFNDALAALSEMTADREEFESLNKDNNGSSAQDNGASGTNRTGGVAQVKRPSVPTLLSKKPQQKSIAERYGGLIGSSQRSTQKPLSRSQTSDPVVEQPRRRLVQGRKRRDSSSPPPEPSDVDSENDSAVDTLSQEESVESSDKLLDIINNSSPQDLADLSEQPEDVIKLITENKPFASLSAVRAVTKPGKGRGKGKAVGERFVETCERMMSAFTAIDNLADHCRKLGQPLANEMRTWGVNVYGSSEGQGDVELELVNLDGNSEASSERDSGLGTPNGTPPHRGKASAKAKFLGKPGMMAEELDLKDYQLVGLNWLSLLFQHRLSCILADDMGLGKTCQVIAFLTHLKEIGVQGPHMIVVQSSTLENWIREFDKFSPQLLYLPYHGSQAERALLRANIEVELHSIDVIVTTYKMTEAKDDLKFLRKLRPTVCVYDEAQMIKNADSQRYKQLMSLKSEMRLLLTGTPVQNNLQELTALLGFIMPDEFAEHQEDLAYVFKHKAKTTDSDHTALLSTRRIMRARQMMTPFILRRKKHQVLKELASKTIRVERCGMTEEQKRIYGVVYGKEAAEVNDITDPELAGEEKAAEGRSLMQLRQAATHYLLLQRLYNEDEILRMSKVAAGSGEFGRVKDEKLFFNWRDNFCDGALMKLCYEHPGPLGKWMLPLESSMDSGKVAKLLELLKKHAANGDRTLVFSQWTSMLDILEVVLTEQQINYCRLDGSTSVQDRQALIDDYNNVDQNTLKHADGLDVFLLSTKAGGTGVNLATANKVVIFDSGFNPQEDIQAGNRAHRVGQKRDVEVIHLVAENTIEEKIWALGESKLKLDAEVAGEAEEKDAKATEEKNMSKVQELLEEEIRAESPVKARRDVKDEFMDGLKNAGLDMSAAERARRPQKRTALSRR